MTDVREQLPHQIIGVFLYNGEQETVNQKTVNTEDFSKLQKGNGIVMRKYDGENGQLKKVICNSCKKELKLENGYLKEGCFSADYVFGYFSRRDGIRHRFDLCEECYNNVIAGFEIPAEELPENELL